MSSKDTQAHNTTTPSSCTHEQHDHHHCCSADKAHHEQHHADCNQTGHHHHEHCCTNSTRANAASGQCCSSDEAHHQSHHLDCVVVGHHHHHHDSCCSDDQAHHQAVHADCDNKEHHHHVHGHDCCSEHELHHAQAHPGCKVTGHHHHHHSCNNDSEHQHAYEDCSHAGHQDYDCCSADSEHHTKFHADCAETAHHHHLHCCNTDENASKDSHATTASASPAVVDPSYDPAVINNPATDYQCDHKAHQHYNCCSADSKHHAQAHPDCSKTEHHHHEHCCSNQAAPVASQCCSEDVSHHQAHHADCTIEGHHHHHHDSCCSDDQAHHQAVHANCTTTTHHHHQHGHDCCSEDSEHHNQAHADCKVVGHHHHHHDCMQDDGHMHDYASCEHQHEHHQCCSDDQEHHAQAHPECTETKHHHHQHCCSDLTPTTKVVAHDHSHDHHHDHAHDHQHGSSCCGHDHTHNHTHSKDAEHKHSNGSCCGHDHSHEHAHPDLAEFDELYHEQGCGCGHHHDHSHERAPGEISYKPVADYSKSLKAQAQLDKEVAQAKDDDKGESLIQTDLSAFMSHFKLLHDKLYPNNSFYHTLGLIYGAVATDYEDVEFLSKQYLESSNSKVNRDFLDFALKTFTYIQANYLFDDFYLNDLFASFDKSANGVEKLTNFDLFLDAYCFSALYGISQNPELDRDVVDATSYILKDLNTFGMIASQLAVDINYKASKFDNATARNKFLELEFDFQREGYDEQEELSLTIARTAVRVAKGEKVDEKEYFDLSPVLSLAVESYDE